MKIAFLTSSLEPGKDGVGDYTRLLAGECRNQSHSTCLVALHDRYLGDGPTQGQNDGPALRLGSTLTWPERVARAEPMLAGFDPDWVSLQFVGYGFNDRGLVGGLGKTLSSLVRRRKTQIMLHELWIGDAPTARFKDRIVGTFQRHGLLKLVHLLAPRVVHTSNSAYACRLRAAGVAARELPLFGSIPVRTKKADDWLFPRLQEAGLAISTATRERFWLFGMFGTLHPVWPSEPLFARLQEAARAAGKGIGIVSIGNLRSGEARWQALARSYSGQFCFLRLGEQTVERISEFFNSIDFGIAATPYEILGKSASTAAMLEHGLPVIVNREGLAGAGEPTDPNRDDSLILRLDAEFVTRLLSGPPRGKPEARLPRVAARFLEDLAAASHAHGCC